MPPPPPSGPPRTFKRAWLYGLGVYLPSMLAVGVILRWMDRHSWSDALQYGLTLGVALSFAEPVKDALRRRGMGYFPAACLAGLVAVALGLGLWVGVNAIRRLA